ncbi:MAG: PIN domain-containing protein [Methanomicrobia archaeon]|nr:PIN domain-containing protein [Methanomicrobia archaeon]
MNPVVVDSSVLIDAILYVKTKPLEKIISHHEAFVPVNVLEETLFKTIIGIVGDSIKNENLFEIKKAWIKGIGKEEVENRFNVLFELIQNDLIKVLDLNTQIFKDSYLFSKLYGLLPNDALIAATCKHHGIRKIATFDPDFKRVDFLEIITQE